jgi:hypothetical protein
MQREVSVNACINRNLAVKRNGEPRGGKVPCRITIVMIFVLVRNERKIGGWYRPFDDTSARKCGSDVSYRR